jgi:hypothetical protein
MQVFLSYRELEEMMSMRQGNCMNRLYELRGSFV